MRLTYFSCPRCGGPISKGVLSEGSVIQSIQFSCRDSKCRWSTREAPQVEMVAMVGLMEKYGINKLVRVGRRN